MRQHEAESALTDVLQRHNFEFLVYCIDAMSAQYDFYCKSYPFHYFIIITIILLFWFCVFQFFFLYFSYFYFAVFVCACCFRFFLYSFLYFIFIYYVDWVKICYFVRLRGILQPTKTIYSKRKLQ